MAAVSRPRVPFLHSLRAAIDLASIMVGVIVIGLIAGVISASVFAVIPWAQDNVAQSNLDAVKTAQSVSRAADSRFRPLADLETDGKIQNAATVDAATNTAGTCYAALSRSDSGKVYYATDRQPKPRQLFGGIGTDCITEEALQQMMDNVGGDLADAGPVPVATDLTPDLSLWTLTGGAYRESDYVVMPALDSRAVSPLIRVDGASFLSIDLAAMVPSGGNGYSYLGVSFFDADKNPVLNDIGYVSNGQAISYPANEWHTPYGVRAFHLGPNVEYAQVQTGVSLDWGVNGTKFRSNGITIIR